MHTLTIKRSTAPEPVVYLHPMGAHKNGSNAASALISMRIPREVLAKLRYAAEIDGVGYQTLVKQFIQEGLDRIEGKKPPPGGYPPLPKKDKPKKPEPLPHGLTDDDLAEIIKDL